MFRNIEVEDEGEYSCQAIIDGNKEEKVFELKVVGKSFLFLILFMLVSNGF